jgi:hypothetical protein
MRCGSSVCGHKDVSLRDGGGYEGIDIHHYKVPFSHQTNVSRRKNS